MIGTLFLVSSTSSVLAQEKDYPAFTIGGLAFGDFYHVLSSHLDNADGATGMVLRRGYLTSDVDFNADWFGRLRFEINQSGEFETYTFDIDFKDLYAGLRLGQHSVLAGLSPTPTFDLIESQWGLRYLARTPLDLQGVASRDTGVSSRGPLAPGGELSYRAMIGSGLEFGNESGDGLKWMGALTWRPTRAWTVDVYADYERLVGEHDRTTLQAFVGYSTAAMRVGLQYSNQNRQEDPPLELASGYLVVGLDQVVSLIGRIDRLLEPSPRGNDISYLPFDPTSRATFFIVAVEFKVADFLFVTPNSTVTVYDTNDEGIKPSTDFLLRLTLFLNLE